MVANILHIPPAWSKDQNSTFSEQCHVAYQIKGNHKCSNLVKYFSRRSPTNPGGQKVIFQNKVMLHIKFKGMEHRAPCIHTFSLYTHPQPVDWIKKVNKSESGLEVIKLEYILKLKLKHNDWLLADTCLQAANHCALLRV